MQLKSDQLLSDRDYLEPFIACALTSISFNIIEKIKNIIHIHTHKYNFFFLYLMAHKTITISQDAYDALKNMKEEHESFTDVILRVAGKRNRAEKILEWIQSSKKNTDLADAVESIYKQRNVIQLRY